jgi:hypothetical protein
MVSLVSDPFAGGGPALDAGAVATLERYIAAESADAFAGAAIEIHARGTVSEAALAAWLAAAMPDEMPEPTPLPSGVPRPPMPDVERWLELGHSELTTPYRLWSALVEHEVAAFAFWSYASAHATPDGRALAEALALTALDRAKSWRARRRETYVADAAARRPGPEQEAERALAEADAARDDATLHEAQARSEAAIRQLSTTRIP